MADAPATRGETARVTFLTAVPKLSVLVVSVLPTGVNGAAVPVAGVIVTPCVLAGGLMTLAVRLTTPPDAMGVVSVNPTLAGATAVPAITVTPVTTSVAAVPPDGVYVTT